MPQYIFHDGVFEFYTAYYGSQFMDRQIVFRVRIDTTASKRAEQKGIKSYDRIVPSTEGEIKLWLKDNPEYPPICLPEPTAKDGPIILFENSDLLVYRKTGQQDVFVKNKKIEGCYIRVEAYYGGLQVVAPESYLSPYSVHGLPAFQVQGGRNT